MNPLQLLTYYANLLILQYLQKPKAYATAQAVVTPSLLPQTTVQSISFSGTAASGSFILNYTPFGVNQSTLSTTAIAWNASAATIQGLLRALTGLGSVTVTGSIAAGLVVTFTGVPPVAPLLTVTSNSLQTSGAVAITLTVAETDVTLPLTLQNAFNLTGSNIAAGKQLDVLGKYAGVFRSGNGFTGPITLNDSDFLQLIQLAIVTNNEGSDLSTIQSLLNRFFPNEIFVFDYRNMRMSYLISSTIGSQNLVQLFVTEGLLPRPMGVQLSVTVYAPIINSFFGFITYDNATLNAKPFNTYDSYTTTWTWLSYSSGVGA